MVKTHSQFNSMEPSNTENVPDQIERTETVQVLPDHMETVPPVAGEMNLLATRGTTNTESNSDSTTTLLNRIELMLAHITQQQQNTSQQISSLIEQQQHTVRQINNVTEQVSNLSKQITADVTEQVKIQMEQIQSRLDVRFQSLEEQVTSNVMVNVQKELGSLSSELNNFRESMKVLPTSIETVTEDLPNLRIEHSTLKSSVQQVLQQAEGIASKCDTEFTNFLKEKDEQINHKLQTELKGVVQAAATEAYEKHNTSIQKIQEELAKVNTTISEEIPNLRESVKKQILELKNECTNVREPVHEPLHTPHSSIPRIGGPEFSDFTPRNTYTTVAPENTKHFQSDPVSGHITLTMPQEESLLKHRQFQTFIPEKKTVHPVTFIKSFEDVFPSTWKVKQKTKFVIGYIQGEAALWAAKIARSCETYEQNEDTVRKCKFDTLTKKKRGIYYKLCTHFATTSYVTVTLKQYADGIPHSTATCRVLTLQH